MPALGSAHVITTESGQPVVTAMNTLASAIERRDTFGCFGSRCTVIVADAARDAEAAAAVRAARERLLEWHGRFSRFLADSELTLLNDDPREVVPVTPLMRRVLDAALQGATLSGGLVDATLVGELGRAGYDRDLRERGPSLRRALELAPERTPAGPEGSGRWRTIEVNRRAGTVTRPPGVKLDPGGIAKGVFADELGTLLSAHDAFVVDCAGDIRLGGRTGALREVQVASPFDESILHTFELACGGVTTSGIGARSWFGPDGRPAHHLLDPASGRPAFTGVVQATALAPSAAEAEVRSKAAVLAGPQHAHEWLPHGGVVVFDDGSHRVLEAAADHRSQARCPGHSRGVPVRRPGNAHAGSSAHGTTTASSCGESRATTYSAGSLSERFSSTWVSRGGT